MIRVHWKPEYLSGLRRLAERWLAHPVVEQTLHCLAAMAAGFVLAGVSVGGTVLPLAVGFAAALGLSLPAFMAYLGSCAGYAVFHGLGAAVEPMAAGLLVEACACIFGDHQTTRSRWFGPASAAAFSALVGILFLLDQQFAPQAIWKYIFKLAVAGGSAYCFRRALSGEGLLFRLFFLASLCAGLCPAVLLGMPLGLTAASVLACAAAATRLALPVAALCGAAMDLSLGSGSVSAAFLLAALASGSVRRQLPRTGIWLAAVVLATALTGTDAMLAAAAVPGCLLAQLLPAERVFGLLPVGMSRSRRRLQLTSGLLEQLSSCLTDTGVPEADPDTAAVFDRAADRVCRMCSMWEVCWESEVSETCDALNRGAPAMMGRGKALRTDLPAAFVRRCRHLEGFLTAINRELDDMSCRRQYRSRLRETRAVLAKQYRILAQAMSAELPEKEESCRFRPELGFRSQGRRGDSLSGDQGAGFRWGKWYFVLLCDGMGTGKGAAAEATAAISVLKTLLRAGVAPSEALQLLNGIYLLRDDGGFATVDLLQADLVTGEARLYKWGAAPSYLKRRGSVEKIGTASPPPGVGVGETHRPEGARLSLSRGEMLVLVSDGAGGESAERFIRQYGGLSPKELASGVVSCSQTQDEDDRTAAVLTLRPCISL